MIDFSFAGIEYGWLLLKIQTEQHYAILRCDEDFSDPLPGMIRMYNALKEGRDFSWKIHREKWNISFKTTFRSEDKEAVWLTVELKDCWDLVVVNVQHTGAFYKEIIEKGTEEEHLANSIIAEQEFDIDVLLQKFRTFFHLLTSSKLYPCHYPCWSMSDETPENDRVWDEADLLREKYPDLDDDEIEQLRLLHFSEHLRLSEAGEEFYREFNNMMRTYKVPDGWQ